jgi:ketosteroid isomerase-like protein
MRTLAVFSAMAALVTSQSASAGPAEDATRVVTTVLDKFNGGDVAAFAAAHRDGAIIIDEFAPYSWTGSETVKRWLDAYAADAKKRGISNGRVDYGAPLQASSDGSSAYVVLPTTYSFAQNGKKMAGKGSMTFVMAKAGADWKIASWTYSGATPSAR